MFKSLEDDVAELIQELEQEVEQDPEPEQEVGQEVDQEVKQNRRNWFQTLLRRLEDLREAVKMALEEAVEAKRLWRRRNRMHSKKLLSEIQSAVLQGARGHLRLLGRGLPCLGRPMSNDVFIFRLDK